MKKFLSPKGIILSILLGVLVFGLIWGIRLVWLRPVNMDHFFTRSYYGLGALSPEQRSIHREPSAGNFSNFESAWAKMSPVDWKQSVQKHQAALKVLEGYEGQHMSPERQESYDAYKATLERNIYVDSLLALKMSLTPFQAEYDPLFFLLYAQPVQDGNDANNFLARMRRVGQRYDDQIASLIYAAEAGSPPLKSQVEALIQQHKIMTDTTAEAHPLYKHFVDMLVRVDEIEMNQNDHFEFMDKFTDQATRYLLPAQAKFISRLEQEILPLAVEDQSTEVGKPAMDKDLYLELIAGYSGEKTDKNKLEILLRDYNQAAKRSIKALFDSLDISQESFPENIQLLEQQFPFSTIKNTRTYFEGRRDTAWNKVYGLLEVMPSHRPEILEIPVEVKKPFGLFEYLPASLDGSKSRIWLDTVFANSMAPYRYRFYGYRYLSPGFHFSRQIQVEQEEMPLFRRTAHWESYAEGWGLYAAHLPEEFYFYNDPWATLSYWHGILVEASTALADLSLHLEAAPDEVLLSFLQNEAHISASEAQLRLDRIKRYPGRATAGLLGLKTMNDLLKKRKAEAGDQFFLQDFHKEILLKGNRPLSIVR